MSHAKGTYTGTGTLYARGVSLEDFLSSDIELLLEYFFHSPVPPAPSPTLRKALARDARASGVFRFLCSPLHHFVTNHS